MWIASRMRIVKHASGSETCAPGLNLNVYIRRQTLTGLCCLSLYYVICLCADALWIWQIMNLW